MSPLENVQPAASSAPPAKPTSDAALAMRSEGAENAPPPRAAWSAIQRKGHLGSFDIFGADAAPSAPEPAHHEPPAAPVAPGAAALGTLAPRDLCLKDLRAACRERGINPGGGKEALEERLPPGSFGARGGHGSTDLSLELELAPLGRPRRTA